MSDDKASVSMGVAGTSPITAHVDKPPDFEDLKRLRRMGRRMLAVYADVDPQVEKAASNLKISCKAGCSGCCYLMAMTTLPEAVAIAEYFLEDIQRRQSIPLLMRSLFAQIEQMPSGMISEVRQKYFEKKVPCTFLDTETNLCTIYSVRPSACRWHLVVSDPKLCQPEAGLQTVARVDTKQADVKAMGEALRVSNQVKMPFHVAPLPVMMMWAFKLLIEGREAFNEALKDAGSDALSLNFWMDVTATFGELDRAARTASPQQETLAARSD